MHVKFEVRSFNRFKLVWLTGPLRARAHTHRHTSNENIFSAIHCVHLAENKPSYTRDLIQENRFNECETHEGLCIHIFMHSSTDSCVGGIMFLFFEVVCSCVRECMRLGLRPVSAISYKPMNEISLNFGWWRSWGDRQTDKLITFWKSKGQGHSKKTFEWDIMTGEGVHIHAWASKCIS